MLSVTLVVRKLTTIYIFLCLLNVITLPPHIISDKVKLYLGYPKDSLLNFTSRSANHGYDVEKHTVTTEDGYLLTVFHMLRSRKCFSKPKYPPVILMHGLLMSSDTWLDAGPDASIAYLLANECFDLWIGNVRGNFYGRRHIKLDPNNDPEFWNFSSDEMGFYDIPATLDYVINQTGTAKVNYIGYSQGASTFFAMCSDRPDYCDKARMLIALAPASRLKNSRSKILRVFADQLRIMENVLSSLGINEVLSQGGIVQQLFAFVCKYKFIININCKTPIIVLDSDHKGSIKPETLEVMYGHFPAGTSVHTFARYGQALWEEGYRKFDYGESGNLKLYGQISAPYYNLSASLIPTVVMHGNNDYLVDPIDVKWLVKGLPKVLERIEVADPKWNHMDFMYSQYNKLLVLPNIIKYLLKYSDDL